MLGHHSIQAEDNLPGLLENLLENEPCHHVDPNFAGVTLPNSNPKRKSTDKMRPQIFIPNPQLKSGWVFWKNVGVTGFKIPENTSKDPGDTPTTPILPVGSKKG